jgi:hypothetical protein
MAARVVGVDQVLVGVEHTHPDTDEFFMVLDGELISTESRSLTRRTARCVLAPRSLRRAEGRQAPATRRRLVESESGADGAHLLVRYQDADPEELAVGDSAIL